MYELKTTNNKTKIISNKIPDDYKRFCSENLNIQENHIIKYEDKVYKIIESNFYILKALDF